MKNQFSTDEKEPEKKEIIRLDKDIEMKVRNATTEKVANLVPDLSDSFPTRSYRYSPKSCGTRD